MKLRLLVAAIIFIGSYFPLSLILLAQNFDYTAVSHSFCWGWWKGGTQCILPFKNAEFSISIFLVCLVCFIVTLSTLSIVQPKREIVVRLAKHVPAELMNYVLPYVVSFMSIDYQVTGKFVGFLIFLAWMFLITYKSGQIMLSPLLTVFGWRLYAVSYSFSGDNQEYSGTVLANTPIMPNERYRQTEVQDLLIIKG